MFVMRSTRAEKYRQAAARLRCEAERAKHPDIRRQLLNIATQYDDLANLVEQTDPLPVSGQAWRDR
jgi:hypothetical protein